MRVFLPFAVSLVSCCQSFTIEPTPVPPLANPCACADGGVGPCSVTEVSSSETGYTRDQSGYATDCHAMYCFAGEWVWGDRCPTGSSAVDASTSSCRPDCVLVLDTLDDACGNPYVVEFGSQPTTCCRAECMMDASR